MTEAKHPQPQAEHPSAESHPYHFLDDELHHPPLKPFSRLMALIRPDLGDIRMVLFFALFVSVLSLVIPITIQSLVETVQFGVIVWPIIVLSLVMFGCLLFVAFVRLCETWVVEYLQQRFFIRVLSDMAHRLPRVRIETFDNHHGPDLANRFFDVITVQKAAATLLLDGIEIVLAAVVGMVVLAFYHPILLAFDIGLILLILLTVVLGRGGIRSSIRESHAKYETAFWLQEIMRVPRTSRIGSGKQVILDRANHLAEDYLQARKRHFGVVFRQTAYSLMLQVLASTLLLGVGGFLVVQGQLTWGQLVAAELIVALIVTSFSKIGKYIESFYDLLTGVEKLGILTDLPLERASGEILPSTNRGMQIKVNIKEYESQFGNLEPMYWEAESNERVALVGPAGAGKSVVLDMLAGFREPTEGNIELDGMDLRDLKLDSVRQQVAMVSGTEIFTGSILDNIRMGRTHISLAEVRECLHTVNLSSAITALPDGINSSLTPSGAPLSSSQSLRLCIARAMVSRPRLLILDGVLDQLDPETSIDLVNAIFDRSAFWTLLVVSRNSEIIQRCDRIIQVQGKSTVISSRLPSSLGT